MPLYAFSIDLDRCIGCQACVVACKTGNERTVGDNYIEVHDIVTGQMPAFSSALLRTIAASTCSFAACVGRLSHRHLDQDGNGMTAVDAQQVQRLWLLHQRLPLRGPNDCQWAGVKVRCLRGSVQDGGSPTACRPARVRPSRYGERSSCLPTPRPRPGSPGALSSRSDLWRIAARRAGTADGLAGRAQCLWLAGKARPLQHRLRLWQNVVQPFSVPLVALSVVVTASPCRCSPRARTRESGHACAACCSRACCTCR